MIGISVYSLNPKEAEDVALANEVIDGLKEYLEHPRCVALGEIGFNNMTPGEEKAFIRQLEIAKELDLVVIVHLPHTNKPAGTECSVEIIKSLDMNVDRIILDHNTEDTIAVSKDSGCYAGMTVYPISKLTPERVSNIIRTYGSERTIVNGSADWGVSDPLSLVKVVKYMQQDGHATDVIQQLVFSFALSSSLQGLATQQEPIARDVSRLRVFSQASTLSRWWSELVRPLTPLLDC